MSWQKKVEQREYRVVKNGTGFDNVSRQYEVVWKDSKELGMARAKTPDGKSSYVVARYRPAGNFVGNFEGNVFQSKSKDPPSFIKKSGGEQESKVVERSWGSPGQSQTRVIVKETRTNTPQGTKTVKTTTTWTTSSNVQMKSRDLDEKDDSSRKFKSLDISDAKDEGKPVIKASKTSSPKPDKPADTSRPGQSPSAFQDQAIKMHNHYRQLHQVPKISWNNGLARDAQAWAEKIARQNTLRHATSQERNGDGENLAYFGGKIGDVAKDSIDMWYSEEKKYQYKKPGFKSGTGHFTQVVWKESKEVGMGWAKSPDGRSAFIVARYRPAGNMMGSFDQNVFPPKK